VCDANLFPTHFSHERPAFLVRHHFPITSALTLQLAMAALALL
jgi:hypothetical protein